MRSTIPFLTSSVTLSVTLMMASACGGSNDTNNASSTAGGTGGSGAAGGGATSTTTTGTGGAGTGGMGTGGMGTGGSGTGGVGTGGMGTGGMGTGGTGGSSSGAIVPALQSSSLYVNCQPIVAPDPVIGSFTAKYTNNGAVPASATITTAKLHIGSGANAITWVFPVTPPSGGPVQPGSTLTVMHTKQPMSGAPEGAPCNYCNATWQLEVTWDIGGNMVTDSLPASPVDCVF